MSAVRIDFIGKRCIEQGASFSRTYKIEINGTPADLSYDTKESSIRASVDANQVLVDFLVTISGLEGQYTLSLTPEQTASLNADEEAVYDVKWTRASEGSVIRLQQGLVEISGAVTRVEV